MPVFHLAFPIHDIDAARAFYGGILGCKIGRQTDRWIDFDFFGHQLSAHLCAQACEDGGASAVDGDAVPLRHFGVALEWTQWEELVKTMRANAIPFVLAPKIRFSGEAGEQGTFFVRDPSGNALEFKTFRDPDSLFAA